MGLSDTTVKHLLLLLNFVYAVLGLALVAFGIYFLAYVTYSVSIGENVAGGLIIGLGVVIVIIAVFGCLAAIHEAPRRLLIYVVAIVVLILVQLMFLSMISHGTKDGLSGSINEGFEKLWDAERNETGALQYYETWLHCCGVNNAEDYAVIHHAVPKSCCIDLKCVDSSSIYKVGCKSQFVEYLDDRLLVFKIVCWLLVLSEAVGAFFGWLLLTGLKNQDRRNNAGWM
ncbi:tetraspanin-9 [Drosophila albomicans]|uniref:Tetraspanin n=1 Tax=Drosophila albomicans TaxID=7291 RepID=A0A6P8X427_DROAB|nr:tetraspanin-9 [Drosophila albomicans]